MKHLIVIDMQNDFIDGALANPAAQAIIPTLAEEIRKVAQDKGSVIFTRDTHYEANYADTKEGKCIPQHCIKTTHGWEVNDTLKEAAKGAFIAYMDKTTFAYNDWSNYLNPGDSVVLTGTCSEICVDANANAIIAQFPDMSVTVMKDCCAGLTPEGHEAAMKAMAAKLIQII